MRRILGLGLLLLTGCFLIDDPGDPPSVGAGLPFKGRVQGQLTPFRGAGQSVGSGRAPRLEPLEGIGIARLREVYRNSHLGKGLLQERLGFLPSGMALVLPAGGVEAVATPPRAAPSYLVRSLCASRSATSRPSRC